MFSAMFNMEKLCQTALNMRDNSQKNHKRNINKLRERTRAKRKTKISI